MILDRTQDASPCAVVESYGSRSADCIRRELFESSFCLPASQVNLGEPTGAGAPILDLWCLRVADMPPALLAHPRFYDVLSEKELERHAAFRFQRNRDLYLAKRLLARGVLSRYTGVQPRDLVFARNGFGRPHLAERCNLPGLHFNLASSDDLAVCLLTREPLSGVDVEDATQADACEVSELILSAGERSNLATLSPQQRRRAVLQHWTLKEAYLKARGLGLNLPLEHISFRWEDSSGITLRFSGLILDDPQRWRFQQHLLFDRYLIATAICCHN